MGLAQAGRLYQIIFVSFNNSINMKYIITLLSALIMSVNIQAQEI